MLKKIFKKLLDKSGAEEVIDKFRSENDVLITYELLSTFKINETIQIVPELPNAILCTRIVCDNPDKLMFTVDMKKNQLWEKHYHDCFETCAVFKGKLKDMSSGQVAGPMEVIKLRPFQSHYIIAEEDSIFYVEFIKPKK